MDLFWTHIYQYMLTEKNNVEGLFHKQGKLYPFAEMDAKPATPPGSLLGGRTP